MTVDRLHTALDYTREGKLIPVQAWTVPEGSRSLRVTDFKTVGP